MTKAARFIISTTLFLTLQLAVAGSSAAVDYDLIVNESSPVTSLRSETVKRLMLGKMTRWDHGVKAQPVDQTQKSSARASFSKDVLKKSVSAVKAYWQSQIFSGRGVPPTELQSSSAVVEFVRRNPGGIGYVAKGTTLTGVRVIDVN